MTLLSRLGRALSMAMLAAFSLGLLMYVGWGDAKRTLPGFEIQKMTAQGELVQTTMGAYLRAGLPLEQFPGFRQISEPILKSDPDVVSIAAYATDGRLVFSAGNGPFPRILGGLAKTGFDVRNDAEWLQVALPLRNRFEEVGELIVTMAKETVTYKVSSAFPRLITFFLGLVGVFGAFVLIIAPRSINSRIPWIGGAYSVIFVIAAVALVITLVGLYSDGAQSKARALANSLAQRITPVVNYGLDLEDFVGLDATLSQYRSINPDIQNIAVILDDRIVVDSGVSDIGTEWQTRPNTYEYLVSVGGSGNIRVAVSLPTEIVFREVVRSAKNFAALFLASGLIAGLFLRLAQSTALRDGDVKLHRLLLVRPIFFLAVLIDNLAASFLPQLLGQAAVDSGLGQGASSTAFTAYFLAFLVVLLPVNAWVDRKGPRGAIVLGAFSVALANIVMAATFDFGGLVLARGLAGFGQGLIFIGIQSAIMANAQQGHLTRAAAIVVFGFNGGMLAGAAIGSLLVNDINPHGVFLVAAVTAVLLGAYASFAARSPALNSGNVQTLGKMLRDVPKAFISLGFLRAFLLIGAPSKAVLTGIVIFAIPLVLSNLGWAPEDIGQVIMLYSVAVLASALISARIVDRIDGSRGALVFGGLVSALGLMLIGAGEVWGLGDVEQVWTVIVGIVFLGFAHGCINAPIITYVGASTAAEMLGKTTAASLYRVVERSGHVLGPIVVGQLLLSMNGGMVMISTAIFVLISTLLFSLPVGVTRKTEGT
ncbi:MFS transporter [Aquibium sp. ELW1220]|uniref:MFS transporter n=1 Tax=Aquibium sp. ELW1220 TaxID=2976766 RepID=UPI0025B17C1C|nr:MFS transporter [Aquibium sp. ELW1220]MDN2584139.1 MFS transporter [Aquibium sp. ELW1220]